MSKFKLNFDRDDNVRWGRLLNEINDMNVIPVIGADLLVAPKYNEEAQCSENLHQQIVSYIAKRTGVDSRPRTFSQLVHDREFRYVVKDNPDQIYSLIDQILSNTKEVKEICWQPSPMLKDLLGTKKFPFVITTSFTPLVYDVMKELWGDVTSLVFNNDPKESMKEGVGDIKSFNDITSPTVYYMFGKYGSKPNSYVVTDSDMMNFCSSWMRCEGVPDKLTEALKKKTLLILGNNYSDWLFRFIWYCLRNKTEKMKSDVIVQESAEQSFIQFMERLQTFFQKDPAEFIRRIKEDVDNRDDSNKAISYTYDVFISYSRTDIEFAEKISKSLKAKGLKVWFDKESIPGGHDWKNNIEIGISGSKLFLPVLTKNIEKESITPHEYREEWNLAARLASNMGGRTFIVPFAEEGFDFYSHLTKLPSQFTSQNAVFFKSESDIPKIKKVIVKELKNLQELEKKQK